MELLRTEDFDKTVVPDKWFYFEIMDRAHILLTHLDAAFSDHPGLDEEHSAMALQASELIGEIYQWAGHKLEEVTKDES
jgi:hypothetical protein